MTKTINASRCLSRLSVAAIILALLLPAAVPASADPINILFVGNSITHGRYDPVLNYNGGPGDGTNPNLVHDLACPTLPCLSPEAPPQVTPGPSTPGGSLLGQLNYLQAHPSAQYNEVGPFGGLPGIFLQFTKEAGLDYNVSMITVSSATLNGFATGSSKQYLPLIASAQWNQVVLQDQTFEPLPSTITVNGASVPTRGNIPNFQAGVTNLVTAIDAADLAANPSNPAYAKITLAQTPPLAAYGYNSTNPAAPIFGSSTVAQQGGNPKYAPYIGDPNPDAAMAADLHNAYVTEANNASSMFAGENTFGVALAGDAWITAINLGIAQEDPFLVNEPAGQIDLWDSNPYLACCTTPIGYHPSVYGDYLNALMEFGDITGDDPMILGANDQAAADLGISPTIAVELQYAAELTLTAGGPAVPEPSSLALLAVAFVGIAGARRARFSRA